MDLPTNDHMNLNDKITELFHLKEVEFDPERHFKMATDIVIELRPQLDQTVKLKDFLSLNPKLVEDDVLRTGEFLAAGLGGALSSPSRIDITSWRDNLMRMPGDSICSLIIRNRLDTVVSVSRAIETQTYIELGGVMRITYVGKHVQWQFHQ